VLGPRLGEITTQGYTMLDIPNPRQTFVHAFAGAEELGSVFAPDLAINAAMEPLARAMADASPVVDPPWRDQLAAARADYLAYIEPTEILGPVNMGKVMAWLSRSLPVDAVVTSGAGNYTVWVHRFFQYKALGTQLAPTSGSMGFGVPAAVAAKITAPARTVVSVNGDGCFMMLGQELATAVEHGAAVIFVIVNNSMLGTIRMHQERNYPGRVIGTDLTNPDFVKLAEAYGAHGERVEATADFAAAFERSVGSGRPAVIDVVVDAAALTPTQTLDGARRQGEART
jgi:acetolactate synthase-1/2/3 large subunit